jgi:hypothetical protein
MPRQARRQKRNHQIIKFPQAKDKIVELVEIDLRGESYLIEVRFKDKTALTLNLDPCVSVRASMANWKTGEYKGTKSWKTVHSD